MANPQNLVPNDQRTPSQRRANASKAGKASGKARRERKAMQELARAILDMPLKAGELDDAAFLADTVKRDSEGNPIIGENGKPIHKNLTVGQAALMAQASKAVGGDSQALAFLRDTAGERPTEKVEVSGEVERAAADIKAMIAAKKAAKDG